MIIFLLVTDETRVLFIKDTNGSYKLPNSKDHWPITKLRPKSNWPISLLKHITYGLYTFNEAYERHRPFGFPVGTSLIVFKISSNDLDTLFNQVTAVRRWAKYNSSLDTFGFKHKMISVDQVSATSIDLQSAHGLRFMFPKSGLGDPRPNVLGTLTNDP